MPTHPTPHGQVPEALEDFEVRKLAAIGVVSTLSGLVERRPIEYHRGLEDQFVRGFRAAEKRLSALSAAPAVDRTGCTAGTDEECTRRGCATSCPAQQAAPKAAPQQEAQEPVATLHCNDIGYVWARATEVGKLMRFEQPINLYAAPQPAPAPLSEPIDQLERALAIIGVVGAIDGHDVVRRESVLEIARRAALAAQGGKDA